MLNDNEKRCCDCQIPHGALQSPKESSFVTLFESDDILALIMLTGFDHTTFQELYKLFAPGFHAFTTLSQGADDTYLEVNPGKKFGGHPWSADCIAGLAIVLSWTCTQGAAWVQSMMFGITGSTLSNWMHFGWHCLGFVLYDNEHAKIEIGSNEKIWFWKEAIATEYPDLDNVYITVDWLKLWLQKPGDGRVQNYFYNGWTSNNYISNLFALHLMALHLHVFLMPPDHFMTAQWPTLVAFTHCSLMSMTENGGKVVMDSAIARAGYDFIIKSWQEVQFDLGENAAWQNWQATSAWHYADWEMHVLQGS
jgi:hypothetical protein